MNNENRTLSSWFSLNSGKVHAQCPDCHSSNISYHRIRKTGIQGRSASSKGLSPVCLECGKGLPTQSDKEPRSYSTQILALQFT